MHCTYKVPAGDEHRPGGIEVADLPRILGRRDGVNWDVLRTSSTLDDGV